MTNTELRLQVAKLADENRRLRAENCRLGDELLVSNDIVSDLPRETLLGLVEVWENEN